MARTLTWRHLLSVVLLGGVVLAAWWLRHSELGSAKHVLQLITTHQIAAPALFVLIYTAFVVFMLPALPLNLTAGFLFGPLLGAILATAGGGAGCVISFAVARYCSGSRIVPLSDVGVLAKLQARLKQHEWLAIAVLRLNPIVPTGPVNYVLGLTDIRAWTYTWSTLIFLFPPALVFAILGSIAGSIDLTPDIVAQLRMVYIIPAAITLFLLLIAVAWFIRHTSNQD